MIVINDDKRYCLYYRTNKRVRWRYAEYGGRYLTVEDAIASARNHANGKRAQILIEDMDGVEKDVIMEINEDAAWNM